MDTDRLRDPGIRQALLFQTLQQEMMSRFQDGAAQMVKRHFHGSLNLNFSSVGDKTVFFCLFVFCFKSKFIMLSFSLNLIGLVHGFYLLNKDIFPISIGKMNGEKYFATNVAEEVGGTNAIYIL